MLLCRSANLWSRGSIDLPVLAVCFSTDASHMSAFAGGRCAGLAVAVHKYTCPKGTEGMMYIDIATQQSNGAPQVILHSLVCW